VSTLAPDPATVAVIRGYLEATSREMGVSLTRNAASPIFVEGQDFSCAILDARRELVAAANFDPSHLCSMAFAADWAAIEVAATIGDDDVVVLNDPYRGGTHVPDVTMLAPVTVDGALVAYVVTRAHHLDVGGMSPGSVPAGARDVFAEGLRIPPMFWERGAAEVPETVEWIMSNVRLPRVELSDFRAQVASLRTGQQRIRELCRRYGAPAVTASMDRIKDFSEQRMRALLESIPDGTYRGRDLLDGDGNTTDRYAIAVTITIAGSDATLDFTGSSRQADGSINLPFASTASAVYSAIIPLAGTSVPFNHGCFRPLRFIAPRASIVNAQPPAPTFGCTTDAPLHVIEAILGALAEAIPERVIAGSYATCNILAGSGEQEDGEPFLFWFFFEGGWGASAGRDGWNCTPNQSANFRDYPVEVIESEYPVRCNTVTLLSDSGGAGEHRGGLGTAHEFTFLARTTLSGFGDRHELRPRGRAGGLPGAGSRFLIQRSGETEWRGVEDVAKDASKFSHLIVEPGDRLRVENGGGGGFGDPGDRDPVALAADVADGVVSTAVARSDYGVAELPQPAHAHRSSTAPHPLSDLTDAGPDDLLGSIRAPLPVVDFVEPVRAVVREHEQPVCRATCPLQADPLRCPYHHAHALDFWPVDALRSWTVQHCRLQGELLPLLPPR
jgi:N-methylhydantoinase B/oxoprolinase/acetone carboxylase alpha subunit